MIWWLLLALALPTLFIWTVAHEGSHALTHLIKGNKVTSFIPWPHKSKFHGKFLFGEVIVEGKFSKASKLAPYVLDFITFVACLVGILLVENQYAWNILLLGLAAPTVNTLVGVQGRYRSNIHADLSRVDWKYAMPFYYLLLAYVAVIAWVITK